MRRAGRAGLAVVAVGGNALTAADQTGTAAEIEANAAEMAACVSDLVADGWAVAVVHGNGPQVGNLAMQQDEARRARAGAAALLPRAR